MVCTLSATRIGSPTSSGFRLAGVDLAEVAPPRALVAPDEEGRLAVLPALEDVRAASLLAHRVQPFALHQRLELLVLRTHLGAGLDPRRLLLDGRLGVADLEPQHLASFGCNRHAPYPTRSTSQATSRCRKTKSDAIGWRLARPTQAVRDRGALSGPVAVAAGRAMRSNGSQASSSRRCRSTLGRASSTVTVRPTSADSVVTRSVGDAAGHDARRNPPSCCRS